MTEWKGKKVLITGGTKGLGLETAQWFAREGADVYLSYRSDEAGANAAVGEIRKLGVKCEAIQCDLSEADAAERLFDQLQKFTPTLDLYVHNAAATAFKPLLEIQAHHIDKTFNITVKAFILGVRRAAALMKNGGAIVAVSGMDTLKAVPRHGLLGAAKTALETLVAYYADELARANIRVNAVNPGFFDSDSTRRYVGPEMKAIHAGIATHSPAGRLPGLPEIAEVIGFLASKRSSWIAGQTLKVDGGFDFAMPSFGLPGERSGP